MKIDKPAKLLVCLVFLSGCTQTGKSATNNKAGYTSHSVKTITADSGGEILDYALRVAKFEENGTKLKFGGRCLSACTLYLALPKPQLCVGKNAHFGFHLPYDASTEVADHKATKYMMRRYPSWVRNWIRSNGGLTKNLKIMKFSYASRHLKIC